MKPRPDLLDEDSPGGLEVFQLTGEDVPSSHVYMEAQIFTPDSRQFLLHRSAAAHGGKANDPAHRYLVCDIDSGCEIHPITEELGATAPSVSPDGKCVWYFIDETQPGGGRLTLKRVNLDGTDRRTVLVIDSPLPGESMRPSWPYPLSTISSDGKRLAIAAFLGDGKTEDLPWGLMIFDLEAASVELILHGQTWCNLHPQYSRSAAPDARCDLLIQENHGHIVDATGRRTRSEDDRLGADIHVIRDDGTNFRAMPLGRDGVESSQGHQCWRGRSELAICGTEGFRPEDDRRLIEGRAVPDAGHLGCNTPGARPNDLTREFPQPGFTHFATDAAGRLLITDAAPYDKGGRLFLCKLPADEGEPMEEFRYLLSPRSTCRKESHIHPFLSPDGTMAFFNSDESGLLQAYMVRGW